MPRPLEYTVLRDQIVSLARRAVAEDRNGDGARALLTLREARLLCDRYGSVCRAAELPPMLAPVTVP